MKGEIDLSIKSFISKIPFLKKLVKNSYLHQKGAHYEKLSKKSETDEKLVVFESFQGRSYSCSPKAIYEYMKSNKKFSDYNYVWVFRDVNAHGDFPENTKLVLFDSEEAMEAYSKAGTWIVNSRLRDFYVPRSDQRYIQCWHGTPLKTIGCDVTKAGNATSTVEEIHREYSEDGKKITKFLSPCNFTTQKLASAFGLSEEDKKKKIIQQGYPRNDGLFSIPDEDVEKFKKTLGIPENKKVVLYCPTFRDDQYDENGYSLEIGIDFDSLKNKCGEDIVILFRAHYFIASKFDFTKYKEFVIDVSNVDDINYLYLASDMLITDYSSVFFDYANLMRPMIFYLYDSETYQNNRDFYFGTAMLPGVTVHTQDNLEKAVIAIADNLKKGGDGLGRYSTAITAFNKRYNSIEDGYSTERTVKELFPEKFAIES